MAEGRTRRYGRLVKWAALVLLAVYIVWMVGPYLRSVVVRDSAVTAWIQTATAPIYGQLPEELPQPGMRVGGAGVITEVVNRQADRSGLDVAAADVRRAEAEVVSLKRLLQELERKQAEDRRERASYAKIYQRHLELDIDNLKRRLGQIDDELTVLGSIAERVEKLTRSGYGSESERDEASLRLASLTRDRVELETELAHAYLLQEAAQSGVFMMADGSEPIWSAADFEASAREVFHARAFLAEAEARLERAWAATDAADAAYRRRREGQVVAPPGSLVWSMRVGAGATVDIGDPIADWIDCGDLLVDVPLADAEIALLGAGMTADVLFEGESRERQARVLMTRGSAAVLGRSDLAALAKGRAPGVGQVLLQLGGEEPATGGRCPVGQAAFVDFHEIGLLEVIAARLRLL